MLSSCLLSVIHEWGVVVTLVILVSEQEALEPQPSQLCCKMLHKHTSGHRIDFLCAERVCSYQLCPYFNGEFKHVTINLEQRIRSEPLRLHYLSIRARSVFVPTAHSCSATEGWGLCPHTWTPWWFVLLPRRVQVGQSGLLSPFLSPHCEEQPGSSRLGWPELWCSDLQWALSCGLRLRSILVPSVRHSSTFPLFCLILDK